MSASTQLSPSGWLQAMTGVGHEEPLKGNTQNERGTPKMARDGSSASEPQRARPKAGLARRPPMSRRALSCTSGRSKSSAGQVSRAPIPDLPPGRVLPEFVDRAKALRAVIEWSTPPFEEACNRVLRPPACPNRAAGTGISRWSTVTAASARRAGSMSPAGSRRTGASC
jgi:hypothetical protein